MIGNISLGFMLGMSSIVSKFLGISFRYPAYNYFCGKCISCFIWTWIKKCARYLPDHHISWSTRHWVFKFSGELFTGIYSSSKIPWGPIEGLS